MSIKKALSFNYKAEAVVKRDPSSKRRRFGRCFSNPQEISTEPAVPRSLKEMDSFKFKSDIKGWAKAVVAYARQVSVRRSAFASGIEVHVAQGYSKKPDSKSQ